MGGTRFPALQAGLSHHGLAALNACHWPNPVPLFQHSYNEQEMRVMTRFGNLLAHGLSDGPPIWKSAIQPGLETCATGRRSSCAQMKRLSESLLAGHHCGMKKCVPRANGRVLALFSDQTGQLAQFSRV
jgi:hypothetical protein